MFDRAGIDITPIRRLVPRIAGLLEDARAAGLPIVYTKQQHRPDLADAGGPGAPHFIKHQRMQLGKPVEASDGSPSRILVAGTWNTDIVPELAPRPGDIVVGKHRYSAFFETQARRAPPRPRSEAPDLRRGHHQRVRRVDRPRRDVPRLSLPRARGLHRRADRVRRVPEQSRGRPCSPSSCSSAGSPTPLTEAGRCARTQARSPWPTDARASRLMRGFVAEHPCSVGTGAAGPTSGRLTQ